jgi:ATP-dependent Lon protease
VPRDAPDATIGGDPPHPGGDPLRVDQGLDLRVGKGTHDEVDRVEAREVGANQFEVADEKDRIGVSTGLVRTETGGDIIFVEAAKMKGKKELIITGSLGDVMRESAQAALSYIRSNAEAFGIADDFFERHDIHIHVPSGAIQKDGPSAGITILTALVSLLTGRAARRDVALTGEITLTGRILPVGNIEEKILAAKRAKVATVVVPARNKADVDELPPDVRKGIDIRLVDTVSEVMASVLI